MSNRAASTSTMASHPQSQQGGSQQGATQQGASGVPHDKIAMRAYEKWCKRGCPAGTDKQDWYEAETELRTEMSRQMGGQRR